MVSQQHRHKELGTQISIKEYRNLKDMPLDLPIRITSLIRNSGYLSPLYQEPFFTTSFLRSFASTHSDFRILEFQLGPSESADSTTFAIFSVQITRTARHWSITPAGAMFGYPGPIVVPGFEASFLMELREWANKNFKKFNILVGKSPDLKTLGQVALATQKS